MIVRALLVALVACQLMWHGYTGGHYLLAGLAALPLLAVLPGAWRQRRGALVVSGYLVILYFVIGATELIAGAGPRLWPALQVALALGHLAWLHLNLRSGRISRS